MKKWGLFHKFAVVILVVGLFPMFVLSVFVSNGMMTRLEESVQDNYEQAVFYVDSSLENIFSTYNEITKTIYQYAPSMGKGWSELPSDNLRQVLNGECFDPKRMRTERNNEMEEVLLKNLQNVDSYIYAAHFVGFDEKKEKLDFHYSARNTFFKDEKKFEEVVGWENWDRNSKKLLVVPPHINSYYNQGQNVVFSLARNYFDTRGSVGRENMWEPFFLILILQG